MSTEKVTEINGVTYTDTLVDDVLVSTVWVDSEGTGSLSRTIDAVSGDITEITSWTNEGESDPSLTTNYVFDTAGNFKGGTRAENGVTYTYDSSWTVTQTTYELLLVSDDAYASTFGNASVVSGLFGVDVDDIQFQITNSWEDESNSSNSGKDVSFFDKDTGTKLGVMYVNNGSWTDNSETILSTNINFNSVDGSGGQQWLGGSWANYAAGALRDSGSNSRTTVDYSTITAPSGLTLPGSITLVDATEIIIEAGKNTWVDPQGDSFSSEYTRYYTEVGDDQVFLWETQTRNGVTTTYDSNWNQIGKPKADPLALKAVAAATNDDAEIIANTASLEKVFGKDIKFLLLNTWTDQQNANNSGKEYGIFDGTGLKLGSMNVNKGSWSDDGTGETYLSTNIGFNAIDANGDWQWLGGSWNNYDSNGGLRDSGSNTRTTQLVVDLTEVPSELAATWTYSSVVVEDGSNTWTDPQGNKQTSTFTRYFADDENGNDKFVGGTDTQDGVTRTVDANWNQLGQPSVDTGNLPTIGAEAYTETYGNAATVLKLLGGSSTDAVLYKITNSWQDESNPDNKGTNVSFFDATTGTQLGEMHVNEGSWTDNGEKVVSTNIGFNSMDANGDWQWLGGSWANYAAGELRDSGSNSRTTVDYSDITAPSGLTLPGSITLVAATEIIIEAGKNTWVDPQGDSFSSEYTRYYTEVGDDQVFLWETQTRNGVTTTYDSNWNQIGKPKADPLALKAVAAATNDDAEIIANTASLEKVFGKDIKFLLLNTWTDQQNANNSGKEYGIFDGTGLKLGSMNVNKGSWSDDGTGETYLSTNIGFNAIDANGDWQWLGGSWNNYDSNGGLRDSGSNTRTTQLVVDLTEVPSELAATWTYSSVVVEDGSNTWTDPQGNKQTSTFTRYFADDENGNDKFVGGTDTQDGVTRTVDANWNQLGQPSVDTGNLPTIGAEAYTETYGNAATVLKLLGGSSTDAVLYKITNSWQDESNPDNKGTNVSFFDATTGTQLGEMHVNEGSWTDNGEKVVSTNISFMSMDANGDWQWLGGSWANYADGEFRDSGSNSRTTVAVSDLIDVPSEIDLSGYNNVVLEVGTDTRIDPQGNERTSSFKRYFETGDGPFAQFLGEIVIGDDGYAQIRDSAGNVFNPSLDLKTDNYTLSLPPGGGGGWGLELNGTAGSDTLDFAAIAEEQDLSGKYNIAVDRIYARLDGQGGDDKIFGAGGMDSLRVHFGGSNFVDGRTNPSYLGSDGNFFSAHDRYVVNHDVVTSNDLDLGDYLLVSVRALVAQSAANAAVLLKDLGGSGALSISSIVDLIDGYVLGEDDTSQFLSVLDQISAKAVSLGIGEMRLDELDALMIKVQSETENSITVEVDFIKDIDMVSVVGQLPDGTSFTSVQSMINPVGYTLQGNDDFSNPFSNGVRGSFRGTNANDQVDLSGESVGYVVYAGNGDDNIIGTDFSDVLTLQGKGVYTIDGGQGYDTADINVAGMWNDDPGAFGLHVEFDEQTNAYTVFDSFADKMEEMLTVSPNGALGWTAISTDYAKEKFDIPDANLTNVESIRIFIGLDKNNNDDAVYQIIELVGVPDAVPVS